MLTVDMTEGEAFVRVCVIKFCRDIIVTMRHWNRCWCPLFCSVYEPLASRICFGERKTCWTFPDSFLAMLAANWERATPACLRPLNRSSMHLWRVHNHRALQTVTMSELKLWLDALFSSATCTAHSCKQRNTELRIQAERLANRSKTSLRSLWLCFLPYCSHC